jgi:2-polyprenyl-3-methyl-5-hydroxy-6-metoxy-1,4-benzoquinol methylase
VRKSSTQVDQQSIRGILQNVVEIEEPHERRYLRFHIHRYIKTLSLIPVSSRKLNVLDVGISSGQLAILVRRLFDYEVSGVDIDDRWNARLSSEGIGLKTCDFSKDPIPYDAESFDVILFCETLEHLAVSPYRVLDEVWRVMKEDGVLILSTPNMAALFKRLKLLVGKNPLRPFQKDTRANDHIHEYTRSEITSVIADAKFKLDKLYLSDCWEKTFNNLNPLRLAYKFVVRCIPSFRGCIILRARKLSGGKTNRASQTN